MDGESTVSPHLGIRLQLSDEAGDVIDADSIALHYIAKFAPGGVQEIQLDNFTGKLTITPLMLTDYFAKKKDDNHE